MESPPAAGDVAISLMFWNTSLILLLSNRSHACYLYKGMTTIVVKSG